MEFNRLLSSVISTYGELDFRISKNENLNKKINNQKELNKKIIFNKKRSRN